MKENNSLKNKKKSAVLHKNEGNTTWSEYKTPSQFRDLNLSEAVDRFPALVQLKVTTGEEDVKPNHIQTFVFVKIQICLNIY